MGMLEWPGVFGPVEGKLMVLGTRGDTGETRGRNPRLVKTFSCLELWGFYDKKCGLDAALG